MTVITMSRTELSRLRVMIENKRLSEALEMCRAMQAELPPKLRSRKAPARTAQAEHMFGVS